MGYESRLYVVDKSSSAYLKEKDLHYAEVIAQFNLCKVPTVAEEIRKYRPTDVYIFNDSGDEIIFDKYGEPLTEIPIKDMIEIIEKAQASDGYYRRYTPCLQLLKGFNVCDWSNLVVLHYGY